MIGLCALGPLNGAQYIGDEKLWRMVTTVDRMIMEHQMEKGYSQKLCSDSEFLRRAYLGITGVIPEPDQAEKYLKSNHQLKRVELVDELLSSEGYVHRMYEFFADMIKIPFDPGNGFKMGWGEGEHVTWLKHQLRENTTYSSLVRQLITATGTAEDNPATILASVNRMDPEGMASNVSKAFLGIRIGCAQCHNHRFDKWTQKEFYEFASHFSGVMGTYMGEKDGLMNGDDVKLIDRHIAESKLSKTDKNLLSLVMSRSINKVYYNSGRKLKYPADYKYTNAKAGEAAVPRIIFDYGNPKVEGETPLIKVGNWLTSKGNDQFSRNFVNRMWQKAFGVGLVEPVDDFRDNTQPINEGLLEYLTEIFIELDYDMKAFLSVLYNSEFMNTKVVETNVSALNYDLQGNLIKRMSAEQLWDSMLLLGRGPFNNYYESSYDAHQKKRTFQQMSNELYEELKPNWLNLKEKHWGNATFEGGKRKNIPALINYITSLKSQLSPIRDEMKGYEKSLYWTRPSEVQPANSMMMEMSRDDKLAEERGMNFAFRDYDSSSHLMVNHRTKMLLTFGANDRSSLNAGGTPAFSVIQALELLNGDFSQKVSNDHAYIYRQVMAKESIAEKAKLIYLSMLSRYPTQSEFGKLKKMKASYLKEEMSEQTFWKDFMISLINTPEFLMII